MAQRLRDLGKALKNRLLWPGLDSALSLLEHSAK
jgi:hypothetical protein